MSSPLFEDPSLTDSESSHSNETAQQSVASSHHSVIMPSEESTVPAFGNALQRYAQQLTNALSKFKITDDLVDGAYTSWSRSIFDCLETLKLHNYLKSEEFKDPDLNPEKQLKTKKIVVNIILNRLDKENHTQCINRLTDPEDPSQILYQPSTLWEYLKSRHFLINAQRLAAINKSLNSITIQSGDSISTYLDKFKNLFIEFTRYHGKMDDVQSAL